MSKEPTITLATRGSALALTQTRMMLAQCHSIFPRLQFDIRVIKTTGDKLLTGNFSQKATNLPKGLFTKELEVALMERRADMAVHSLKDLPTDLPPGLTLGAVSKRADPRDVLIYCEASRSSSKDNALPELPNRATIGTSSTRRRAQLLALRADLEITELRGNVVRRLQKLASKEMDAVVLAAAGMERMKFEITADGRLVGENAPEGLRAKILSLDEILPCVGQGALGIEIRTDDEGIAALCERLKDFETNACVTAERAFLAAMGGGCASPVAAYAEMVEKRLWLRAISFPDGIIRRTDGEAEIGEAEHLGRKMAAELKAQ